MMPYLYREYYSVWPIERFVDHYEMKLLKELQDPRAAKRHIIVLDIYRFRSKTNVMEFYQRLN